MSGCGTSSCMYYCVGACDLLCGTCDFTCKGTCSGVCGSCDGSCRGLVRSDVMSLDVMG
jgi:hypothetical protein